MRKKLLYTIATLIIIGGAVAAYYQFGAKKVEAPTTQNQQTVTNSDAGVSFVYESGFSLVESPVESGNTVAAYVLIPTEEYDEFTKSTDTRETPASISVMVYTLDGVASTTESGERLDRIARLQNWAQDNATLTSFNQVKATPDIVEVDGVKSLHYQADGLYQQDIYLASYKNRVYMFTAQYNGPSDKTFAAFPALIQSVTFE